MSEIINIYCDESCHLKNDEYRTMLVSCTYCAKDVSRQISEEIRALKQKHKIWRFSEIKWKKVSQSKKDFYMELLDYFLNNANLKFRTIIIPDKSMLNHEVFGQDHNIWYYKMIYQLVEYIIKQNKKIEYKIYTDKKENSYKAKSALLILKECLQTHFAKEFHIQNITSHQSEIMQLNDFLQGMVSFYNRNLHLIDGANPMKTELINRLIHQLNINLSTTNYNGKFNILKWEARNC